MSEAEYLFGAESKNSKYICHYCCYAISPINYRRNFIVYLCKQKHCDHLIFTIKVNVTKLKKRHYEYHNQDICIIYAKYSLEELRINK